MSFHLNPFLIGTVILLPQDPLPSLPAPTAPVPR